MNVQAKYPTTAEDFLRWNEGREGKREFVRGRVVELMIHTTRNHARIAANMIMQIGQRLDLSRYDIGSADFGVMTEQGVRYPDIYVDLRTESAAGSDLAASAPVLLCEILSPSSYGRDFVDKLEDYRTIPTLRHYLILSQDEPRAWLWSREQEGGDWNNVSEVAGDDETLSLQGLSMAIPLSDLYSGILGPLQK